MLVLTDSGEIGFVQLQLDAVLLPCKMEDGGCKAG